MKVCTKCNQIKPLNEFSKNQITKDGYNYWCKICTAFYQKEYQKSEKSKDYRKKYREKNREKVNDYNKKYWQKNREKLKDYRKNYRLQYLYNFTLGQHKQMYIGQNRRCAICDKPVEHKKIHTDHNHITGQIRGLLCENCNRGLGQFKADEGVKLLLKAVKYIENNS